MPFFGPLYNEMIVDHAMLPGEFSDIQNIIIQHVHDRSCTSHSYECQQSQESHDESLSDLL